MPAVQLPAMVGQLQRRWRWLVLAAGVAVLGGGSALAYTHMHTPVAATIAARQAVAVTGPVQATFSQPVAEGYASSISPAVAGHWQVHKSLIGISAVMFVPNKRFEAGRTYTLRLANLKRSLTGGALPNQIQTFTVQTPPAVKAASPAGNAINVATKPQFKVVLAAANRSLRDLKPALTPTVALKQVSTSDQTYIWEPVTPLAQGTAYTFTLDDAQVAAADQRRLVTIPFTTVTQPRVVSTRTGGYVTPGQVINVIFDQPMKPVADAVSFGVAGKGDWIDTKTYRYTPTDLKPGTTYPYSVKAGLAAQAGGVVEADQPFSFATNGAVGGSVNAGGTVALNTPVRVTFDQNIDHATAEARFSTSPGVGGSFGWSSNTMTFTPAGMAYQTSYRFSVAAGVVPVWGLPSTQAIAGGYTTENQVVKLNVPAYKQAYPMSCELASLRMLLAYRGVATTDRALADAVGYNPRPRDKASNTWDDPNQMYVGYLDGIPISTSYGVHAGPVAAAARSLGRNATSQFGVSAGFIAAQIYAGNPVEVWGHSAPASLRSWNTASGVVQVAPSQHARVIYGVVGSAANPAGFHLIDPWDGAKYYWTTAQLMANMNVALPVSNQAVVVY